MLQCFLYCGDRKCFGVLRDVVKELSKNLNFAGATVDTVDASLNDHRKTSVAGNPPSLNELSRQLAKSVRMTRQMSRLSAKSLAGNKGA